MSVFAAILWGLAIFGGLLAAYVAFVSSKAISVKANLSLLDDQQGIVGSVEVLGSDPTQVAEALDQFEIAWTGGPVKTEVNGIEVGDVDG